MVEGYCMKCKEKRVMKKVESIIMKNGRPANKGICEKCSTKMFKIGAGPSVLGGAVKSKKRASKKSKKSKKSKVSTKSKTTHGGKSKRKSKRSVKK